MCFYDMIIHKYGWRDIGTEFFGVINGIKVEILSNQLLEFGFVFDGVCVYAKGDIEFVLDLLVCNDFFNERNGNAFIA